MHPILRSIICFALAWISLSFIGTFVGAQFVLAELSNMGADVGFGTWFKVSFGDAFAMLPFISLGNGRALWVMILGFAFLLSMISAEVTIKWGPSIFSNNKEIVYASAGFISIFVVLLTVEALFFSITPIAATRGWSGFIMQCLVGATAGYIYFFVRSKLAPNTASQ